MNEDLAVQIMRERVTYGVDIVEEIAKSKNIPMSPEIFIKGVEVGISLFIQKETARRVSGYAKQ